MPRWEYRVLHDIRAPELATLGDEGWELIAAEFDDDGELFAAIAKRPKDGGGGGGGGHPGQGGGNRRRRRRGGGGGGAGGGGGGGQNPQRVGVMTGPGGESDGY